MGCSTLSYHPKAYVDTAEILDHTIQFKVSMHPLDHCRMLMSEVLPDNHIVSLGVEGSPSFGGRRLKGPG